jgi:hypothetical protein
MLQGCLYAGLVQNISDSAVVLLQQPCTGLSLQAPSSLTKEYITNHPQCRKHSPFRVKVHIALPQQISFLCPCRQFFKQQFQLLEAELFAPNRQIFTESTFTLSNFTWAVALVRSRIHTPLDGSSSSGQLALVPIADLVRTTSLRFHYSPFNHFD